MNKKSMRQDIQLTALGLVLGVVTSTAHAIPFVIDTSGVAPSDVHFTIEPSLPDQPGVDQDADQAAGSGEFDPNTPPGNDSVSDINGITWDIQYGGPGGFTLLDKDDDTGSPFLGIDWIITTEPGDPASAGTWTLAWSDTDPLVGPGLPQTLDFVFVHKASTAWGAYLFDDILFTSDPLTGAGTFSITFVNASGNPPDLSHASIYARAGTPAPPIEPEPNPMPVPGTMLLLGFGLVGLARSRRRR